MTQSDLTKGLKIGDVMEVTLVSGAKQYQKIVNRDKILYRDSHSALAAGGTESYASVVNLEPPVGQIYQIYRVRLERGNVKVYLKQPAATNRWGTNKAPTGGFLTNEDDEAFVNLWIIEDYEPNVQIVNDTNVEITPILKWYGWRYSVNEITEKTEITALLNSKKFIPVTIGGMGH